MTGRPRYLLQRHGLYYRPKSRGYTGVKHEAGRYFADDARPDSDVFAIHEGEAAEYSPACWPENVIADQRRQIRALENNCRILILACLFCWALGLIIGANQ